MSIHINRFVDSVKAHEARGQRDFIMPIRDAKHLHADITKLLLAMTELQTQLLNAQKQEVITVELGSRDF